MDDAKLGLVREREYIVLQLRERARSYARDVDVLVQDDGRADDIAILTTIRNELRKIADEVEAL